ncbi:MAG: hypothetical protein UX91_C0004G0016 [Candidatus Amesbacteria bacterium GW2011_GWB1_47_19]|nr:MAG: hypothetical protein UW51_C0005G0016 [Candidatus Amesbacteria bacterium GW2011_GWA1_44_24]KKU31573.1 MAG: hypothetical protein UX46_C0004G0016 [Candidatus Amesbacteria bacterium GW2011_GWC1_46_24]KKU67346.1 MAG: hypothetical protein UX91_C0004G0016 [Candidatus Amesbacteria bacterium GW2011_GWB1_47_19]OGD05239.1 MAG: hypothetical protein A2379_04500 [Candidatus Amesbacteria bacterium RIFOXYB1_FULL_47_13]HBC72604.1 hypothetical protein [Candidatus Amesbacteria bacterium]
MPRLTINDHIKVLRAEFRETKLEVLSNSSHLKILDTRLKSLQVDFEDFQKNLESSLFKWRSEIHDLIDKGFSAKAKKLDGEVGVLNNRTTELRQRVEKLETSSYTAG